MLTLLVWSLATAGGLGFFLFLARSTRPRAVAVVDQPAAPGEEVPSAAPTRVTVPARARINTDESELPRWLRPSVQAARQGRADDIP
jgi:hypothetical protein